MPSKIKTCLQQRVDHAITFINTRLSSRHRLLMAAVIVGVIVGIAAALLKLLIGALANFFTGEFMTGPLHWLIIIVPVIGVVATVAYQRYVVHDDLEHGTEQINDDLTAGRYRLPFHLTYSSVIAASLTLGLGGSAGSEGPIAYTGAGIGSNFGKMMRLPDDMLRILVAVGAGAGIAAIFKAPIGGVLFSLEVLRTTFSTLSVIALIAGCLTSAMVAFAVSGFTWDIPFVPETYFHLEVLPMVIILGFFCGLYSIYYSWLGRKTGGWIARMSNPWVKGISTGLLLGVLILVFPSLYGEGYGAITHVINGNDSDLLSNTMFRHLSENSWMIILFLFGLLTFKSMAVSATNSGGGVGGEFAPTLFAGCMAGFLFGYFCTNVLGIDIPVANFAMFGMAGVMAGAVQAPLMAIFITVEMCGDYGMLLPIIFTALCSYFTTRVAARVPIKAYRFRL